MWYPYRQLNDPLQTGYIAIQKKTCGKPNCKCVTKGEKHLAYYLFWREYQSDGTRKLKKKYLKQSEVKRVQQQLSASKGMFYLMNLQGDQYVEYFTKYPSPDNKDIACSRAYELFANSEMAKKYRADS